jgi:hypothetical protein
MELKQITFFFRVMQQFLEKLLLVYPRQERQEILVTLYLMLSQMLVVMLDGFTLLQETGQDLEELAFQTMLM